ncbi:MAG: hypothetical protein JRG94_09055, partial [Deltaproteobacteria bacterium]|nr:hypothetical protein [Deltaproteobacteria bacterium]
MADDVNDSTDASADSSGSALSFFEDRFSLDERLLGGVLDAALEREIDYADLYFEYTTQDSVV